MNEFAISSEGIGAALERSAASFNEAGTSLDSAIALITATNTVLQDPQRVGNMWKTVTMRIRSAKLELEEAGEDTEGMVDSTAELRNIIKTMTGFDIMEDSNTFKDMREIVVGIGKAWKDLNDTERSGLLQKLAGKNQSNALAAALNNWQQIEEVYNASLTSDGSAEEENLKYLDSINGKIQQLSNSWQKLWVNGINSDVAKGAIDFATAMTEAMNVIGLVPSAIGAIGAGTGLSMFLKNLDCRKVR